MTDTLVRPKLWTPRRPGKSWVGTFSPKLVANLYAWYDAQDLSTITDAGAGAVSAWADKSGSGRNLSQGTSANRPKTGTRTIGGKNAIDFDGTNDLLLSGNLTQAAPFSTFLVFQHDGTTGASGDFAFMLGLTGPAFYLFSPAAEHQQHLWEGATNGSNFPTAADTASHVLTATYNSGAGATNAWLDRVQQITNENLVADGLSANAITVGGYAADVTSYSFDGMIGELIVYTGIVSAANRARIETYLKQKWGTP